MPCVRVAAIFLLLAAVCIQGTTGFSAEDCKDFTFKPCEGFPNGHNDRGLCFVLGDSLETFDGAKEKCEEMSQYGELVSITDPKAHMEMMCNLNSMSPTVQTRVWVGAKRNEKGTFDWLNGNAFTGDWEPGQPDFTMGEEKCVEMNWKGMGLFNDDRCERKKNYVCSINLIVG